MPRRELDPLIRSLDAFQTASLEKAEFALQMATQILKRRREGEVAGTPAISLPSRPRQKRRKRQLPGSAVAADTVQS